MPWLPLAEHFQLVDTFGPKLPIILFGLAPPDEVARAIQERDRNGQTMRSVMLP